MASDIANRLKVQMGKNSGLLKKAIFFSLITWIPLLILSLLEGTAINPGIKIPFLHDYVTYTRFLISLPILFLAEKFIKFEITNSIYHFVNSGVIAENNFSDYEKLVNKFNKLQKSIAIGIIILALALIKTYISRLYIESYGEVSSWEYYPEDLTERTLAGYWFILVSLPIFQFLVFRMLWKFLLWSWFLWKISKMKLNLIASDPDKTGGLSFLAAAQMSFGFLALAQAASFSSEIANKVIYGGVPLEDFKFKILIAVICALVIYLSPLFFFMRKLTIVKLEGLLEYGALTHKYSYMFNEKWIKGKNDENEPLLGTGDIQSLADIGGSYERIQNMKLAPISFRLVIYMFILIALPFLPLLTLKIPLTEILKSLAGFFL